MKLEMKRGRKTIQFDQTKRCVKIFDTPVGIKFVEWNLDESEPYLPYNNVTLIYYAEFFNGVIEYVNSAGVSIDVED